MFNSNPKNNIKFFNDPVVLRSGASVFGSLSVTGSVSVSSELSTGGKFSIDQNANVVSISIDSEATTQPLIEALTPVITSGVGLSFQGFNSLDTGGIGAFQSNSADSSTRTLFKIENTNASATGATVFEVVQGSTGAAIKALGGFSRFSKADVTPAGTAATIADDIILGSTDTTSTGLTIFSSNLGTINFGDVADDNAGSYSYTHSSNTHTWGIGGVPELSLNATTLIVGGDISASSMQSGTTQGGAGAAAGELWHNTTDDSVRIGV